VRRGRTTVRTLGWMCNTGEFDNPTARCVLGLTRMAVCGEWRARMFQCWDGENLDTPDTCRTCIKATAASVALDPAACSVQVHYKVGPVIQHSACR
jgi:hypothetical protein